MAETQTGGGNKDIEQDFPRGVLNCKRYEEEDTAALLGSLGDERTDDLVPDERIIGRAARSERPGWQIEHEPKSER